ncbi:MAG: vWA domain-containing protein [Planctomycetota bacterium]
MRSTLLGLLAILALATTTKAQGQVDLSLIPDCQNNIVVVLDASGSMSDRMRNSEPKMAVAKEALNAVMRTVPATTNVGLLCFGAGRRKGNDWLYPLGPVDANKIQQVVNAVRPGGNTPLGAFMKKGVDRLLQQREEQHGYGSYRLLVVTDGQASDADLVNKYLPDILGRGVTVDVIGVSMPGKHALATRVHSYRSADDPTTLRSALQEVFAEVGSDPSGGGQEEAFELLRGLPDDLAPQVISALVSPDNRPVGQPRTVPASHKGTTTTTVTTTPSKSPVTSNSTSYGTNSKPSRSIPTGTVIFWIVFGAIVLGAISRRSRRRRRR